jgi:hypothetical protein
VGGGWGGLFGVGAGGAGVAGAEIDCFRGLEEVVAEGDEEHEHDRELNVAESDAG